MEKRIIWIIDDDLVSQFATNYRIEQSFENCQVIAHSGSLEGLAFLRECLHGNKRLPDILLLDLVMPGMDGWSFLKELKKMEGPAKKIEVYVLSAFNNSKDRSTAKGHPQIKGFFNKPLTRANVDRIHGRSEV